ncbi:MAG: NTP transferase domain-containing protein [Gammaproteobacteria bacterium]
MTNAAPLFGLVLAGGASTRMRRDKAALEYHGRTQLEWTYELVSTLCLATFVSVRPEQRNDPVRARFPQIIDKEDEFGPLAGIAAALRAHPKAAWLVVACDLPFVTEATLRRLVEARDPERIATVYRSSRDGSPEPLCAIWEPAARDAVSQHLAVGKLCPRKLLIQSDCKLIDLVDPHALENINTPEEWQAANARLANKRTEGDSSEEQRTSISLRVQYFAVLREQAGRSEELLDSFARSPSELYEQLRAKHGFSLEPSQLKVAVNDEFSDWNVRLQHGDTVVFIPPVAGG